MKYLYRKPVLEVVAIKATTIMSASEVQAEIKPGTTPEALSRGNKSGVELDLI